MATLNPFVKPFDLIPLVLSLSKGALSTNGSYIVPVEI